MLLNCQNGTVNLETGELRQLTDDFVDEHSPVWHPDGQRVVYSARAQATEAGQMGQTAQSLETDVRSCRPRSIHKRHQSTIVVSL